MGKMKEEFIKLAEERFMASDLFSMMGFTVKESFNEEKISLDRGEYKNTLTIKFNKDGYPVSHQLESKYEPSTKTLEINKLRFEMAALAKKEDFEGAFKLQQKIKELETSN